MVLEQLVDIALAVEPVVKDHVYFFVPHDAELMHQLLDGIDVGDVTGELAVVKRKPRLFPEQ